MQLRVLTTSGSPRPRSVTDGVALGEIALYGPDLELIARNVVDGSTGAEYPDAFEFLPGTISALAGRPKFVLVYNRGKSATHVFATSDQQQNGEVEIGPGEAKSIQFVAAGRPGRYEFFCKVPGHAARGLVGRIEVR
jgi:plastocyanin